MGIEPAKQIELIGEWDWADPGPPKSHCGSQLTLKYFRDGKYFLLGTIGTWSLNKNILTEKSELYIFDEGEPDDLGRTVTSTLQWVDENTFLRPAYDGNLVEFRRCP